MRGALHPRSDLPALTEPVIVAAFDGWVDAAAAASSAIEQLTTGAKVIARFDTDALYDYRSRRPLLDVVDGVLSDLSWPELLLRHTYVAGRDLLILHGAEPDLLWRALATDIRELVQRLGVVQWVSLGAVPATVAHTRPVPVMATASREGLLHDDEIRRPAGLLRVPSAALSAIELEVTASGIPAARLLRPGAAIRGRRVRRGEPRPARAPGAPSRYHAAARRPRRGRPARAGALRRRCRRRPRRRRR